MCDNLYPCKPYNSLWIIILYILCWINSSESWKYHWNTIGTVSSFMNFKGSILSSEFKTEHSNKVYVSLSWLPHSFDIKYILWHFSLLRDSCQYTYTSVPTAKIEENIYRTKYVISRDAVLIFHHHVALNNPLPWLQTWQNVTSSVHHNSRPIVPDGLLWLTDK